MCFSLLPVQGTLQAPRGVSEIDLKSSEKAWTSDPRRFDHLEKKHSQPAKTFWSGKNILDR